MQIFNVLFVVITLLTVLYTLYKVRKIHLKLYEILKQISIIQNYILTKSKNCITGINTFYKHLETLERIPKIPSEASTKISLTKQDYALSPYTGLTRSSWIEIGKAMLEGALKLTNGMREPIHFPTSSAAGYPRIQEDGKLYGTQEAYLEGYARTLLLASALLKNEPDLKILGRKVADYYTEFLLRGVSRYDSATFGWISSHKPSQRIVEAASLTICFTVTRELLWEPLSSSERLKIVAWLDHLKDIPLTNNNWLWFNVLINTFLKREGYSYNAQLIQENLNAIRALHIDAGWFIDQDKFDYYSAWAFQFYPIFWAEWDGDSYPELREEFYLRNDLFLQTYPHIFSRRGEMPVWGRSVCYRFAASSPLVIAFLRPSPPTIDPGFARRICSGNLIQFVGHPEFLKNGIPSLGFYGENAALIDDYSCSASPFWCSKLFMALTLPKDSPFWTEVENEGFWRDPPKRVEIGKTGMWVEHNPITGSTTLFAPQKVRLTDPRYSASFFSTSDVEY